MLRLLGFPKAKPESGHGCPYCLASRLSVQSGGAGCPRRAARLAPGGCVAAGLDGSQPFRLPPPLTGEAYCSRLRRVGALVLSPPSACPLLRFVDAC